MQNIIENIKHGQGGGLGSNSGFDLARQKADENEAKTGNKTIVRRVLDYADMYNGHRREHYSFDVIEIIND